jgi:hypothetical protein
MFLIKLNSKGIKMKNLVNNLSLSEYISRKEKIWSLLVENNYTTNDDIDNFNLFTKYYSNYHLTKGFLPEYIDIKKLISLKLTEGIDSPEFKKWFGDYDHPDIFTSKYKGNNPSSVVLGSDGKPLIVYHATTEAFKAFELGKKGTNSFVFGNFEIERNAIFVTPNYNFAQEYCTDSETNMPYKGANVMPLYLSMKAPLDFTERDSYDIAEEFETTDLNPRYINFVTNTWELFDGDDGKLFVDACKQLQYDGCIFYETSREGKSIEVYAVFNPNQLKSALSNSGKYSNSNNITESYSKFILPEINPQLQDSFITKRTIKFYGLTNNIYDAFYITPDGSLLDGSDSRSSGGRVYDHRNVSHLIKYRNESLTKQMLYFMMRSGCVRIDYKSNFFSSVCVPNLNQRKILVDYFKADVYIDIYDKNFNLIKKGDLPYITKNTLENWYSNIDESIDENVNDNFNMSKLI